MLGTCIPVTPAALLKDENKCMRTELNDAFNVIIVLFYQFNYSFHGKLYWNTWSLYASALLANAHKKAYNAIDDFAFGL